MSGRRLPSPTTRGGRRIWLFCAGMGVFSNAAPFFLLGWGQQYVTSGFAGIMMSTMPLLVLPLAHVFVPGERMTPLRGLGFGLGFAGVVVLIGVGALASTGAGFEGLARLACLAAAGCYAVGSIITRRCPEVHPLVFGAAALIVAALILVPAAIIREGVPLAPGARPALAVLYLALGPTALATLVLVRVIRRAGPSFLSLVNFQVPLWSVVFGALVLGERLPAQFLAAMGMILAGLAISRVRVRTDRAPRRNKARPTSTDSA